MVTASSTLGTGPFSIVGVSSWVLVFPCFTEISIFKANREDPDQTPRSATADLGPHCLPMTLLWDARHVWVKRNRCTFKRNNSCEFCFSPFWKGIYSKRNFLPREQILFLLDPFSKGGWCTGKLNRTSQKFLLQTSRSCALQKCYSSR